MLASMTMKTEVFGGLEHIFGKGKDEVLKIHTDSLFKSILFKGAEDQEKIVDSKYFSFLSDILTYSLSRKNNDMIKHINIEDKLGTLDDCLHKDAFKTLKNIIKKEPLNNIDEIIKLSMHYLKDDIDDSYTEQDINLYDHTKIPYERFFH